jgi:hypothetical protein
MKHSKPYRQGSRYVPWQPSGKTFRRSGRSPEKPSEGCIEGIMAKTESYGNGTHEQLVDEGFRNIGT